MLLYANRTTAEIAYRNVFDEATRTIGLKTIYAITGAGETPPERNGHKGRIDGELIRREIPDYRDRLFYISGSQRWLPARKLSYTDGYPSQPDKN